jgi:hypothetical protein
MMYMIKRLSKSQSGYRRVLRNVWMGLGGAAVSLLFQACYGMPPDQGEDNPVHGTVLSETTHERIPGIKVSIKEQNVGDITDSYGEFWMYAPVGDVYELVFEDVDGEANGGSFVEETVRVTVDEASRMIVHLTPATDAE